jgi:hypothetical protein
MRFGSAIACTLARNDCTFQALVPTMEKAIVDLTSALRERLDIIRDEESRRNESAHLARLKAISEKIERLQAALPRPLDPQLAHYLQRRSYDKALEFIENTTRRSTAH